MAEGTEDRQVEEWRASPLPELHRTVTAVADQLHEVRRTLRWDGSPGETSGALIALAPMLHELGVALGGWHRQNEQRHGQRAASD